jgi:hypothetical protein
MKADADAFADAECEAAIAHFARQVAARGVMACSVMTRHSVPAPNRAATPGSSARATATALITPVNRLPE